MNKIHIPIHLHSHYSLLDSINKPQDIIKRLDELNIDTFAICDHGSISGAITCLKAAQKAHKKLIIGCELYISEHDGDIKNDNNRKHTHLLVYAKNDTGYKSLLKLVSASNNNFYYRPRLSLNQLSQFIDGNIIGVAGHWGSVIANQILDINGNIAPDGLKNGINITNKLIDIFGKDNLYLEIQLLDNKSKPLVEVIREISKATNIKGVSTEDAHYAWPNQYVDQHVLLATNLNRTIYECTAPEFGMSNFFLCKEYYIHSYDELLTLGNTEEELENTIELANKCEPYTNILKQPQLPEIKCPGELSPNEYLEKLCNEGFKNKVENKQTNIEEYRNRFNRELNVLKEFNLSSYFLIIKDILDYVHQSNWISGPGRGSAAGCLISYLSNITQVDPIKYDLLFERFMNPGRMSKDRVSLPDIDIDIPASARDTIIEYIKNKFGHDKVCQMITIQTMKGRGALKAVFRAHNIVTPTEMNLITKFIPEESKIADELQTMKEEEGQSSIIKWTLENDKSGHLKEWCYLDKDEKFQGPLGKYFEQAVRLEGTKVNQSKHAAGIVISKDPLNESCPMVYDSKTKSTICGFEMEDAEVVGLVKYDLLGLTLLDKIMGVTNLLKGEEINNE